MFRKFWFLILMAFLAGLVGEADAQPIIDRYMTINPIRVFDNAGLNGAPFNTFTPETEKIFAQAGVAPVFLPTTQLNNSSLLSISSVRDIDVPGNGQHPNSTTVNVWFVQNMPSALGTLFGEAWVNANGVAINGSAVTSFNGNIGRRDTLAHEIGHNLALGHGDFGAGAANNLMTSGSTRSIPSGVGDITLDGAQLSQLTAQQITQLRNSPFVKEVPRVEVDTNGSTPFDTNDFFLVNFVAGSTGVSLRRLTMDLTPVNAFFDPTSAIPPGADGSPFLLSNLSGIAAGDISVSGNTDGSQLLTLTFANGSFNTGDSLRFGIDVDLFSKIDQFGAEPDELIGTLYSFEFADGYAVRSELESDLIASSIEPFDILPFVGTPSGGPPIAHGTITAPPDPVPVPGTIVMVLPGLVFIWWRQRGV